MTGEPKSRQLIAVDPVLATAVVVAVLCALAFHGYETFNYTLSIDEELMFGKEDLLRRIQRGRWGLLAVAWLRQPMPVTHFVVGLVLYGAAFVLLMRRFEVRHWQSVIVAAGPFFGFPVLLHAFAFSNLVPIIGAGALIAVAALYVVQERSPTRFLLASLLIAFLAATYQAMVFFLLVIFLADLARQIWLAKTFDWDEERRRLVWYGGSVLLGLLLYGVISFVLLKLSGRSIDYLPSYVQPNALVAHPAAILMATLESAWQLYSGAARTFIGSNLFYRLLAIVCLAVLIWTIVREWRKSRGAALLWGLLLLAIAASPFVQHPLNQGSMPLRTLVGLPAAVAVLGLFAAEAAPERLRRWVMLPLAALVILQFSLINNRLYYGGHWALERDKVLATQILSRLGELFPRKKNFRIAVVGAGRVKHDALIQDVPSSTIGASFFEWDGGSTLRIAAFLNFFSSATFLPANQDQVEKAFEAAESMPSWPAPGSIARVDGVVILKLSEPRPLQLRLLCQGRTSDYCAKHQR
jgi:Glucosyl transferase GtrII